MLASLVGKAPTVRLTLEEGELFVGPVSETGPGQAPVLRGSVVLSLSSARPVKRVVVVLEGLCDVFESAGFGSKAFVTLREQQEIKLGGQTFGKGEHTFEFALVVPQETATHQRCPYGTVMHNVKARVEFVGSWQADVMSERVPVWLCSNPYRPGEQLETQLQFRHNSAELGLVTGLMTSQQLTVAGLVDVKLELAEVPHDTTIIAVAGIVYQAFSIVYRDPGLIARPRPQRHILARVESVPGTPPVDPPSSTNADWSASTPFRSASTPRGVPFGPNPTCGTELVPDASTSKASKGELDARYRNPFKETGAMSGVRKDYDKPHDPLNLKLSAGDAWTYEKLMRMPDDDHLRATTLDGNEAGIRVAHRLGLEIMYRVNGEEEDKVLKLSEEVSIASCRLHRGSVLLPAYDAPPAERVSHPADTPCRCWYTAQEQYERDLASVAGLDARGEAAEGGDGAPGGAVGAGEGAVAVAGRAEREAKTPAVNIAWNRDYVP